MLHMNKVYVFGNKTFGKLSTDVLNDEEFEFTYHDFPHQTLTNISNLSSYPIIILDYDVFYDGGTTRQTQLDLFAKQLIRALKKGSYVVFAHYSERIPRKDQYSRLSDMNMDDLFTLQKEQIGFRFLAESGTPLRPRNIGSPLDKGKTVVHFFDNYLDNWGSSKTYFSIYGDLKNITPIQKDGKDLLSFAKDYEKGKVLFVSCQRNSDDDTATYDSIKSLAKSVMNYRVHSYNNVPDWAKKPLFSKETSLRKSLDDVEEEKTKLLKEIDPYMKAKQLAFTTDENFRERLIVFLREQFNFQVDDVDEYKDDLKILGEKGEVIASGEAKAIKGGVTKGAVYQLYNNREEQGFPETIPGLLFVNQHITGSSWADRDKNVDKKAYEAASKENILIIRVIDLLRLWSLVDSGKLKAEEAKNYLLKNKGWLKIDKSDQISIQG